MQSNTLHLLIVDSHPPEQRVLRGLLSSLPDLVLAEADGPAEAHRLLGQRSFDVAIIDLRHGHEELDRLQLVRELRRSSNAVPILVTQTSVMPEVRAAMRAGARDYISGDSLCAEVLHPILEELRQQRLLEQEVLALRARSSGFDPPYGLVGTSPAIGVLRTAIERVALSERPVLVTGPTGAGKELVVRATHQLGAPNGAPLLDVNCAALPENLLESMLFGHERGAFTGADRRHEGLLLAVGAGTLFLDEIGELSLAIQAKLLRVLETRSFRPLGSRAEIQCSGRVIAATHRDLERLVQEGKFREDLFYRLNVLVVRVPSLQERLEDIPALCAHFVRLAGRPMHFSTAAMAQLMNRSWPGNVRELRNLIDRLAVFSPTDDIAEALLHDGAGCDASDHGQALRELARSMLRLPLGNKLQAIQEALLGEAMTLSENNQSAAARLLGIHRKSLRRRL